jgi:hypothetical protein
MKRRGEVNGGDLRERQKTQRDKTAQCHTDQAKRP